MVDRVVLLGVFPNRDKLIAPQSVHFSQALDKAIGIAFTQLELADARGLPSHARDQLEGALRRILTLIDLQKIAKKWEPKRPLESGATHQRIAEALVELLNGQREPYEYRAIPLSQARLLGSKENEALTHSINDLAPAADLKKLAKIWDPVNKELTEKTVERKEVAAALLELLAGRREPMRPPPKVKKGKR